MLPLIHSPATAPKPSNDFSSAKDIIERERSKKQTNALSSDPSDSGHKYKSSTNKDNTDTELPAMIVNSPPHGSLYPHPHAVSSTTRTIGGVGMTVTSFTTTHNTGRPVSRAADSATNTMNNNPLNNIYDTLASSPRSTAGGGGGYGKPSATEISLANATLIYAEAWRPGIQNVRRRRRSSARSSTHNTGGTITNPIRSSSPMAGQGLSGTGNANSNTTTENPSTGPTTITTTSTTNLLNKLPSLSLTTNKPNNKRNPSPEQNPTATSTTNNNGGPSSSSSLTRAPRLSVVAPKPIDTNTTAAALSSTNVSSSVPTGRPSSQQNSRNPVSSPPQPRQPTRHSTNPKDEIPSKGSGLYAYLLPPANMPELSNHTTVTTITVPPSPSNRHLRAQLPYDTYNDNTEMDVDDYEVLHFMWEGSPYLQSVGNHRLHRSRTPATNKKRRGSRRPKQDSNGSNSDHSPSPSHTKNPTNNTSPGNNNKDTTANNNTNITVLSASPMRTTSDANSSTWSSSSLAGTQSALQASLASSMVWVLGPQGQPVSIPTTLYMGQVLAAGAAGLPMPQLVPPPPLVVSNIPLSIPPPPPMLSVTDTTVPEPLTESKSIESIPDETKAAVPETSLTESKTDETSDNKDSIVGTAYLADVQEHTDGKINLSLQVDVASLPTSARAVLSSHPSFRLVLVTEDATAPVTIPVEEKSTEPVLHQESSFVPPNLIVEEPSQPDVSIIPNSSVSSPGRTSSPERRQRPLPPPPPVPSPVDEYDQARAQALARSVLSVKVRTANITVDGIPSRRPSGVGGQNSMGFNTSGFVPSSPRTLTGAPPVTSPPVSYLRSMAASILQSSPSLSTVSETASAIINTPTVASVASADPDVASYLQGLPAELKHAYPTRFLVSLVSDLCDEIVSVNSQSLPSPPILPSSDGTKCFYTADLASAWLWFLQFARDIRCSWASGTRWAANRRVDRAQLNGPWVIASSLKEEALAILKEIKPVTNTSIPNENGGLFASASSLETTMDSSLIQTVPTTDPPTEPAAVDTSAITGIDIEDKDSTNDADTLFVPGIDENDNIADEAVKAAIMVYEPLGDVVQEDHILRLLKRVPFPSIAAKTLFVRTALAFAGWGSLNVATATVMKTHLEEAKVNSMTDNGSVSRPQSRGIGLTSSTLHYDKNNDTDDLVAEEMSIVEAVLLEPVTLVPSSMVGVYTEGGVRIGPGMLLTPTEAKTAAANVAANTVGGALIGGPSLPSPSSTIGRGMLSIRNVENTFAMGMNSHLRGGITGIGGTFSNAPHTVVDGMNIVSVFDAPAWRALHYVRGRACSPHSLTAILSTPTEGLALHYAFVRQCLSELPTFEELTTLVDTAVSRATYGISPSGATIKEDPQATAEDLRIFAGCPNPPGRQYYPTRYLLALVRSVIAATATDTPSASIPDTELPDTNSSLVKAAWFLFLQLRTDLNATWATAVRWLEAASPGVVSNSLPTDIKNNTYPPGSLNAYIPFGEVAQMDHLLRLLSKLSIPSTEAKALFVRTALAFAGWGALEDAAATIMRSHLDELALDQQENANNNHNDNKTVDTVVAPEPTVNLTGNETNPDDSGTGTAQTVFQVQFSYSSISGFTSNNNESTYYVTIIDSTNNVPLYRTPSVGTTNNDKVNWSVSSIYVPTAFNNEPTKSIALQVWCANRTSKVTQCIGTSKPLTLQTIIDAGKNEVPLTLYSVTGVTTPDTATATEENKGNENENGPTTTDDVEAQGFLHIGTSTRFMDAPSLANVLSNGLQLTATFAIDFTSSNGAPFSSEDSLHASTEVNGSANDGSTNGNLLHSPYATALAILASLVRKVNAKTDIYALGFGAVPALEDITMDSAAVSVIPIRPSTMDIASSPLTSPSSLAAASKISNVSVLMDAYATVVTSVQPGVRRLYQPIIDTYLSIIETNQRSVSASSVHNIFFILTSGDAEDEASVAKQIASLPAHLRSTIVIVCIVPAGTDQDELSTRVTTASRFVENIIQLRRNNSTVPLLYNDIICIPYSPGDSTEERTIAGAILSSSLLSMLSESIIENVVVSSPSPVVTTAIHNRKEITLADSEAEEKRSKEQDEGSIDASSQHHHHSSTSTTVTPPVENPPLSVDAAMVRAEAALTAPIRLVSADHSRAFGKGGVGLQKGYTLGITDVNREIQFHHRYPNGLEIPSSVLTNESKAVLYNPSTWNIFAHVRERVSSDNNLAMLASTPPEALLVHYNFLRGCLTAPACFDKAGFEAQETEAWNNNNGGNSNNRKRDQDYDSDLSNLLTDRTGMGILLTSALRNEISILLGVSPLRATVSSESTTIIDPVMAHPSELDGTSVKVVLLVAKADGRSPMIDPVTKQPIMVRSVVPLENIEMVMAQLGKSSRRQLGPVAALTAFSPHP